MFDAVEGAASLPQYGSRDVLLPAQQHVVSIV